MPSRSGPIDYQAPQVTTEGYYCCDEEGDIKLRGEVVDQIKFLKERVRDQGENNPMIMLLNLVVDCLKIDPKKRPKAPELAERLQLIYDQGKEMTEDFFTDSSVPGE
jgi:hypothetical protein